MKFIRNRIIAFVILFCIFLPKTFSQLSEQQNFEISKYLDIFNSLFSELNLHYIDTLNIEKIIQSNITYMLQQLDPYTEYIPAENLSDFQFQTTGQYGGIGATISMKNDKIIILETYEGMPAALAGLLPGDQILSIDEKSMIGKTISFASEQLKGRSNTNIKIKYQRLGWKKPKKITIKRKLININPVTYYNLVRDKIGYIYLSSFTVQSALAVKEALIDLKKNHQIKALILDIRDNGGGVVDDCLDILNFFLPKGELLLSIKGKNKQMGKNYYAIQSPIEPNLPLAILVNENSASASEILSGTIQDTDRGIIIGTRTYGKGLVQSIYQLPYNAQLKLTTAKYYIPSGRCIQAIDFFHKNENKETPFQIPDTLTNVYYTSHNRPVRDGKGILPDFVVEEEKIPAIIDYMETNFIFLDFAIQWKTKHPQINTPSEFILTDNIYNEFKEFIRKNTQQNLDYNQKSKKIMESLKTLIKSEGDYDTIVTEFQALENKLKHNLTHDLDFYKSQITKYLAMYIVKQYYFAKGQLCYQLRNDPVLNKAIEVLQNKPLYNATLNIN